MKETNKSLTVSIELGILTCCLVASIYFLTKIAFILGVLASVLAIISFLAFLFFLMKYLYAKKNQKEVDRHFKKGYYDLKGQTYPASYTEAFFKSYRKIDIAFSQCMGTYYYKENGMSYMFLDTENIDDLLKLNNEIIKYLDSNLKKTVVILSTSSHLSKLLDETYTLNTFYNVSANKFYCCYSSKDQAIYIGIHEDTMQLEFLNEALLALKAYYRFE